eukprot:5166328-Alexandrium_andersonii.AAC.1
MSDVAAWRGRFWTGVETSTRLHGCRAHGSGVRRGLAGAGVVGDGGRLDTSEVGCGLLRRGGGVWFGGWADGG